MASGTASVPLPPSPPGHPPSHPPPATLQGLTVVHGHWVDGGHRLWVATRMTEARLWVGRVGRVPTRQDRRLPIAPLGRRARVQGVAVLIWRWGAGVGHGHSRAEGRPQLPGPEMGDKTSSHECPRPAYSAQVQLPPWKGTLIFSLNHGVSSAHSHPPHPHCAPCPSPSHQLLVQSPPHPPSERGA